MDDEEPTWTLQINDGATLIFPAVEGVKRMMRGLVSSHWTSRARILEAIRQLPMAGGVVDDHDDATGAPYRATVVFIPPKTKRRVA